MWWSLYPQPQLSKMTSVIIFFNYSEMSEDPEFINIVYIIEFYFIINLSIFKGIFPNESKKIIFVFKNWNDFENFDNIFMFVRIFIWEILKKKMIVL